MKGDMFRSCFLPVYKFQYHDKTHQGHLKVILNRLTNDKNSNLPIFCQFDLEMTLKLPWHDLDEIPSQITIPDHVIICD